MESTHLKKEKDLKKAKSLEYYIYNELDILEDIAFLTKKELIAYKRKFPNYFLEPVKEDFEHDN